MSSTIHVMADMRPQRLRCEHLGNPQGIDETIPRLSWEIAACPADANPLACRGNEAPRGLRQVAYRILVASTPELLDQDRGDLWDSGKVRSDLTTCIEYAGLPLRSRMQCHWKVMAWLGTRPFRSDDPAGPPPGATPWSEPAMWSMGLLEPGDWSASWIGSPTDDPVEPAPLLRTEFLLGKEIVRATAYICGLGYYELSLNGIRVGDHEFDPKVTRYDRRVLYVTHDVTAQVREGANAVGVMLGNGWYNYHVKNPWHFDEAPWRAKPSLLFQLEIVHADGSMRTIVSDGSWKHGTGAVLFDGMLNGEVYDARLEKAGWDAAGYDDSEWSAARVVDAPKGRLVAQMIQPIRITEVMKPVSLTQPKPGVFVYDLGQNIAGVAQLDLTGPAGTDVKIQYAELLHPDGTANPTNIDTFCESGDFQTEHYILKGGGPETWRARFMYYGFQYVQVTGFPGEPTLDSLRGLVMHSDVEDAGSFECSNKILNSIQHCNRWSYLNNLFGYPTDCPNREKIGWTGDAHIAGETALYNFDPMAVYAMWLHDFGDEQQPNGELPGIIPTGGWGYERWGGPAWCSSLILIPWYMYRYRGDIRVLATHYDNMKRYVDFLTESSPDGINAQGMGDWFPSKTETPVEITSTSYYYIDAVILAEIAELLGRPEDAAKYSRLAGDVRQAFNRKFFKRETGRYGEGSQTADSCALYQGLVDAADVPAVLGSLAADVERNHMHVDCGILGAKYILHALSDNGRVDLAYRIAEQTTWPGWGDMVRQGATTLWEGWNADIGTHNHVMLGDISAWFFKALGGICLDPVTPGFKKSVIKPLIVEDLAWAKTTHHCPHGWIASEWKRDGTRLTLDVVVPVNTTATVHLPANSWSGVTESGMPLGQAEGVDFICMDNGTAVIEVGSGAYRFESNI